MNRTRTSKNAKRLLVWLLLLTMVFGLLPMAAFADEAVVEPVVEEPVQESAQPSTEPTEAPSEPTQEPETIPEPEQPGNADVTIEGDEEQPEDDTDAEDEITTLSNDTLENFKYSIVMVDCGRKYYSVENINAIIDSASAAGMHYVMLAVGNNGMRFLLDDMSLTVGGKTYTHDEVSKAIHNGNLKYDADTSKTKGKVYDPYSLGDTTNKDVEELTQNDMNAIMRHANDKGVQIIPLINTPGHMGAILSAATELTEVNCAYNSSVTTIDLSNSTALEFTKALLQKYITYFKDKGCTMFNMGSDEYANDSGSPSFNTSMYGNFITYINDVAQMILNAGMTPMAFNDGIYYDYTNRGDSYGTIDTRIIVCYWSPGWGGYDLAKVNDLINKGFKVINTHGGYYWIVGGNKCTADTAKNFDPSVFNDKQTVTGDNTKNIAGAMFCIWGDEPGSQASSSVPNEVSSVIKSFGNTLPATEAGSEHKNLNDTTPGGSESGGGSTGGGTEETGEVVKVTVAVGEPYTDTINGDVRDTFKQCEDTSVATASVEHTKVEGKTVKTLDELISSKDNGTYTGVLTDDGTNFMVVDSNGNISNTTDINAATEFKVVKAGSRSKTYTISVVGTTDLYLAIERGFDYNNWEYKYSLVTTTTSTSWTYVSNNNSSGFYNNYRYVVYSAGGWTVAQSGSSKLYTVKTTPTDPVDATVITIKGVAEGSTTCKLGNKTYEITVTAEDLTKVTPLKLEYWITNSTLTDANNNTSLTVNASDAGVATRNGVEVSAIVPKTMSKDGRTQEYWQGKLLDVEKTNSSTSGTELQTTKSGDDETLNGSTFTKVRYWEGAWWVYTTEWVKVDRTQVAVSYTDDKNNSQTYSGDKNQLVVYYMEVVDISNDKGESELHVNAADWGTKGDGTGSWGYKPEDYRCSVSVQIVYEEGTTNPADTTADLLKSKTIVYGYWDGGRGLGTMIFNGQQNYEIYKVTAETGDMTSTPGTGNTVTVTSFEWDKNEETVWEGDAQTSVSIGNPARSPSYVEPYDNLAWNTGAYNENNAILIRVYVKAKATADSLTAHYINKNDNSEFYYMNYNVKSGTLFDEGFALVNGQLIHNTVPNYNGVTLTVESDLKKMSQIGAQYRYGNFELVRVSRSDDGKDVYLYYKFTTSRTFVVDFGIPLKIEPKDFSEALGAVKDQLTSVEVPTSSTYADIKADGFNVIYSLKKTLDSRDGFSVKYYGTNIETAEIGKAEYFVEVIPASSVYYEDSNRIVTTVSGKGAAENAKWTTVTDGSKLDEQDVYQALEVLGNKENVYGFDAAYTTSTKFSMGSAQMVTVASSMVSKWDDTNDAWPTATFTFKGTGFDIISLTNNTSGAIFVDVIPNFSEGVTKHLFVDNYYGYSYNAETKTWTVDTESADTLYQIPVMKVSELPYGEYTVTIKVAYSEYFDHTVENKYSFWLDAIRVYDPMGTVIKDYVNDNEGYPQYIKLRDKVADGKATTNDELLFIDGADQAAVALYANYGPNNEVYLAKGQAISFRLPVDDNIVGVQIGAKSPNATDGKIATSTVTGDIATATEMYYDITTVAKNGLVTITNTGDAILSLTNIKITYKDKPDTTTKLEALTDSDAEEAVAVVRALFAAPVDPEPTPEPEVFEPEHFECEWSKNVRKGGRAILTVKASTDVDYIVVGDVTYNKYITRTERIGWGRNAQRVTYREFIYMMPVNESGDFEIFVSAGNDELGVSEPVETTLSVRASSPIRDWIGGLFGRWF